MIKSCSAQYFYNWFLDTNYKMDNNQNNQGNQPAPLERVSAREFMAKYNSKREVYNFLAVDVGVFLPSYG